MFTYFLPDEEKRKQEFYKSRGLTKQKKQGNYF